jgi:hypothetical protein
VLGSDRDGVLSWQLDGGRRPSTPERPIDQPVAERGVLAVAAGPAVQVVAAQTVKGQRIVAGHGLWRAIRPPPGELVGLVMTDRALFVAARAGEVCSLWSVPTTDLAKIAGLG